MRILAIDTALEACAAAVIDTEHGRVATESQPMERGHADAIERREQIGRAHV